MGKIGYLLKKIFKTNYKKMLETINDIHGQISKSKFEILKDIISCEIKCQADYIDYRLFEMYNLNDKQRQTIITKGKNQEIIERLNNPKYLNIYQDKIEFNKKFNKYLLRDWMEITGSEENYKQFKEFASKHSKIFVKETIPAIYEVTKKNVKEIYEKISSSKCVIEELALQCPELSDLHPKSLNPIKIITLNGEIVACFLKIGNDNNILDDFDNGGLVAPINIETGIIDYLAVDKKGNTYERHPLTEESILWFKVPKWPRIKRFVLQAAKEIPEVGYVGWDVSLGLKDPFIVGATCFPRHDVYQLPPHRNNNIGLLPVFEKIINKKGEEKNENSNSNRS